MYDDHCKRIHKMFIFINTNSLFLFQYSAEFPHNSECTLRWADVRMGQGGDLFKVT